MLKSYLKVVTRNLTRYKGYALINIAGLAVGLACCFLILLYVRWELSYDRFYDGAEQIYRVTSRFGDEGSARDGANTSYPTAPNLKAEFPEVMEAVRIRRAFQPVVAYEPANRRFRERSFFFADSTFLDFFGFAFLEGDRKTALRTPNSLVISATTARRFFGDERAVGKMLTYNGSQIFRVDGVLRDLPGNTHLEFDFLAPIASLGASALSSWTTFTQNYTYIKLPRHDTASQVEAKLPAFVERHVGQVLAPGTVFELHLQPLTDIHLRSHLRNELKPNGDLGQVQLFATIAVLVLLIACINFMNLATARSVKRAREVAVRKVVGAHRRQLIRQFLGESILVTFLAFLLALFLVELLLPPFNYLVNRDLYSHVLAGPEILAGLLVIVLLTALLAGSYPALFLSRFRPIEAFRAQSTRRALAYRMRQGLVVLQFTVSIVLIICSLLVYGQMDYMLHEDLGFDQHQVLVVPVDAQTARQSRTIKHELGKHADILSASFSMLVPSKRLWTWGIESEASNQRMTIGTYLVDFDFLNTYGLDIIAGRGLSETMPTDSTNSFLLNETAVRQLGWSQLHEALGQELSWSDGRRTGLVVGVVRDFHIVSLQERIEPIVFFIASNYNYLSVKLRASGTRRALAHVQQTLAAIAPQLPFEYFFIDENFDRLHRANEQLAQTITAFSLIAITIAGLGLFGLAAFSAEQRTKEVGVRKVLGATVPGIASLLSRELVKLVLLANVLAWPVAYFAMNKWLQNFAYRISIEWWVFLLAGGLALLIALLTVSTQAIRAALANPVESLRYE